MVITLVVARPGSKVFANWGLHYNVLACARLELAKEERRLEKKKVVGSGDNHKASTMDCSPVVFGCHNDILSLATNRNLTAPNRNYEQDSCYGRSLWQNL